jgi:hypothetical protein
MQLTAIHADGKATVETVPDVVSEHGDIKIRWFVGLQVMSRFHGVDLCTQPSSLLDLDPSEWTRNEENFERPPVSRLEGPCIDHD